MEFSTPEVDAEILVPYARKYFLQYRINMIMALHVQANLQPVFITASFEQTL